MEDLERRAEALGLDDGMAERITLRPVPVIHDRGVYESFVKPLTDRVVGVVLSVVTFPLVVVIAGAVWVSMGRPVIFKQVRVGRFGAEFEVFKFRTMEADRRAGRVPFEHPDRRVNHKSVEDPRHTDLGRFLRKWSLDEVPQFWNVARGEMSLVGPRPELPDIVGRYEPWQHRRHEVKPGLTGLWQVSARGDAPMHEATDIDIDYVDNVSFVGDLKIMIRTPGAVLGSRKGN
jgi:lipopolysaccharide/colanic/teichoic acid biosynthesis glycosyltransferase